MDNATKYGKNFASVAFLLFCFPLNQNIFPFADSNWS